MFRFFSFCCFFLFYNFIFSQPDNSRYTKTLNDSIFEIGDVILVTCVEYDFDSGRPISKDSVNKLISFFERNPYLISEISVHSNARGNADFNQQLCLLRAQILVKTLLESDSLFQERFIAVGKGEFDPLFTEEYIHQFVADQALFESYHQKNNRTEIKIIGFISKDFYNNQRAATVTEDNVYIGSNYENLLFIADKALLDGYLEKAKEYYLRASALAPLNDTYALDQYKKLVVLEK